MGHVIITMLVQSLIGMMLGRWLLGGALMSFFYLGRELAQAEQRWIQTFGSGLRDNMPFWGGFDIRIWNLKSFGDFALPMLAALGVYAIAVLVRLGSNGAVAGRNVPRLSSGSE